VLRRQAILVAQGERLGGEAMTRWASICMKWTRENKDILTGT